MSSNNRKNTSTNGQIVPGGQRSLWIETTRPARFPALEPGISVDVVIVGGGIVGVTAATLLKAAGKTVAVIERDRVVKNVTGHTTAKITSLHGFKYQTLIGKFGVEGARTYAEANQAAIEQVASLVAEQKIACDFARVPMFLFTEHEARVPHVKREAKALQEIGIDAAYTEETPLPYDIKAAVRLDNQAQFHPRRYLLALAKKIPGDGSHIFEDTVAFSVEDGSPCTVVTDAGQIAGKDIVIATHFPFYDKDLFFARLYPYHSYALAFRISGDVPEGMYFTDDDDHYALRYQPTKQGPVLILSGGHHKTGQGGDTLEHYRKLERYARSRFDVTSIDYFWSTEDYDTADEVPYIGRSANSKHLYVATGFGGWGMTSSTLSAMIITDAILGKATPWAPFFDPSRLDIVASSKSLLVESANVAKEFAKGLLLRAPHGDPGELVEGGGRKMVVKSREVAAYKDEDGKMHLLSPVCPHMGCVVNWNNAERTWDCPCHGSRYRATGEVIHGPALGGLREMVFEEEE